MSDRFATSNYDPDLYDLVSKIKRETMLSINCVQIGTIISYTSVTNTAKVSIDFKRKMADGALVEYPVLDDCPVFIISGGTSFISFPIAVGDKCIILFNDRNIEYWYTTGKVLPPSDTRCHSVSDAIIIVGINPITTPRLHPTNAICINGKSNKIVIKNTSADLKTQIDNLTSSINKVTNVIKTLVTQTKATATAIKAITVITSTVTSGNPVNAASFSSIETAIDNCTSLLTTEINAINGVVSNIDNLLLTSII